MGAGDSFWTIAEGQLRSVLADPDPAVVADYWRRIVSANHDTIRSGDPNLIYPGEIITIPKMARTP